MQTGSGTADAGQYSDDTQNCHNPKPQAKLLPKVLSQKQKKQGRKDGGEAELTDPHQQCEEFQASTSQTSALSSIIARNDEKSKNFLSVFSIRKQFMYDCLRFVHKRFDFPLSNWWKVV